jgi:selenocysteine lyase/cysteine desulfurase
VEGTVSMRWRSPGSQELGGSLYAVEIEGVDSREAGDVLWKKHRIVVRAFHGQGVNTLRISPNVFNTTAEIDRFFAALRQEGLV